MVSEDHSDLVSNTHVPPIHRELLPVNKSDVEPRSGEIGGKHLEHWEKYGKEEGERGGGGTKEALA